MPATTTDQQPRTQPWKAHWSPVDMKCASANQNYMKDNTGSLLIDGVCNGDSFSELACARKETEAPKTQPWKAHWSPVDARSASANQNYMVDNTGSLLIDGCAGDLGSSSGYLFSELACARKETEAPKTQPWKAHWSPVDARSASANQNYMVDNTGSLLIDGFSNPGDPGSGSGYLFSELACARNAEL